MTLDRYLLIIRPTLTSVYPGIVPLAQINWQNNFISIILYVQSIPDRSKSATKTSDGQLPTGNSNQINSNEFSRYNSPVLALDNSENDGPPGDRWQDHSLGMVPNINSGLTADQNDEGFFDIYNYGSNFNIYSIFIPPDTIHYY